METIDPRAVEISRLYDALVEALERACTDDTSADDIVSACFTLTLAMMISVVTMGGSLETFREPLEQVYRALPKPTAN